MRELLTDFFRQLQDRNLWTFGNVIAVLGAVAGLIALAPIFQKWRTRRLSERSFGADYYEKSQIEKAARYYVRPHCSSIAPANEEELRHATDSREDIFDVVDSVIHDEVRSHVLLLGDSGTGKSAFTLAYYARNQRRRRRKRQRLAVFPLPGLDALAEFAKISDPKSTVLFLDTFDEDPKAREDYRARLTELIHASRMFKCVLITCRTQFFPRDDEIPQQTGSPRFGPQKLGETRELEFRRLYILPLNDGQVERFLRRRYPIWRLWLWKKRRQARVVVRKIRLLSMRPMLLTYIPDLLKSNEQDSRFAVQLYDQMVKSWLKREGWADEKELESFSEGLAVDFYVNWGKRKEGRVPPEELAELLKAFQFPISRWKITDRWLLNHDGHGHFRFAHPSIMEYLFVRRFFAGDPRCRNVEWTDLMKQFCLEQVYLHYESRDALPLSLAGADLTNTDSISVPALYHLRANPVVVDSLRAGLFAAQTDPLVHIFALQRRSDPQLVTDHAPGLTWQQCGSQAMLTFGEALRYLEELNLTHHCGYSDWRLPTADELVLTMGGAGSSDAPFAQERLTLWTCDKTTRGQGIYYLYAQLRVQAVDSTAYVRAVRSIPAAPAPAGAPLPFGQPQVLVGRL